MSRYPIPAAALDDRLGFVGTSGSGKTYNACAAVEHILDRKGRVVIVDPLGVWWGLRLSADGAKQSPYPVVIFGGAHGDLPLNEQAGALLGETVAGMQESCIVDLSGLGTKSAERRFMLAFLEKLYRNATGEPFHVVFDEADLWAPQKSSEPMLQNLMEQIVRRGRVKGFVPWLITQRPAVLSKDVLSQVDGLVAFKLTSSQDRDALEGWIEGQADRQEWRRIRAELPTLQRGSGVVWIPARGVLAQDTFPAKRTFDSSRTPKRGETMFSRRLTPIDLGALKDRLSKVETEAKANDPKALKAEIARLTRELAANQGAKVIVPDAAAIEAARKEGRAEGERAAMGSLTESIDRKDRQIAAAIGEALAALRKVETVLGQPIPRPAPAYEPTAHVAQRIEPRASNPKVAGSSPAVRSNPADAEGISGPQRQLLAAISWWAAMGHDAPSRAQVAAIAGWRVTSGHLKNVAGSLRSKGMIDYPSEGTMTLTDAGRAVAPEADDAPLVDRIVAILNGPQRQVFDALLQARGEMTREAVARACGWEPTSGHIKNVLGSMRSLEIIDYPKQGSVALAEWVTL